jgi:trimeric autotransporter adhesin
MRPLEFPPTTQQRPRTSRALDSRMGAGDPLTTQHRKLRWAGDSDIDNADSTVDSDTARGSTAAVRALAPLSERSLSPDASSTAPPFTAVGGMPPLSLARRVDTAAPRRKARFAGVASTSATPSEDGAVATVPLTAARPRVAPNNTPGVSLTTSRRPLRMAVLGEAEGSEEESDCDGSTAKGAATGGSLLARFADLAVSGDDAAPSDADMDARDGDIGADVGEVTSDKATGPTQERLRYPSCPGDSVGLHSPAAGYSPVNIASARDSDIEPSHEPVSAGFSSRWPPASWWEALEGTAEACAAASADSLAKPLATALRRPDRSAMGSAALVAWVSASRARVISTHFQTLCDVAASSLPVTDVKDVNSRMASAAAIALNQLRCAAVLAPAPSSHSSSSTTSAKHGARAPSNANETGALLWGDDALAGLQVASGYIHRAVATAIACISDDPGGSSGSENGDVRLATDTASALGLLYNCAVVHVNALTSHAAAVATTVAPTMKERRAPAIAAPVPRHPSKPHGGHAPHMENEEVSSDVAVTVPSKGDGVRMSPAAQLGSCDIAVELLSGVVASWESWVLAHEQLRTSELLASAIAAAKLPVRYTHFCTVLRHRVDELSRQMADPDTAGPILGAALTVAKQSLATCIAGLVRWHVVDALPALASSAALASAAAEVAGARGEDAGQSAAAEAAVILVAGLSHTGTGSPLSSLAADLGSAAASLASALRRSGVAELVLARAPVAGPEGALMQGAMTQVSPDAGAARLRRRVYACVTLAVSF